MRKIWEVAADLGIDKRDLILYGDYKAKIRLDVFNPVFEKKAKYILVSAMTPTKFGEGKTTTTIGLSMLFNHYGKKSVACIRQPSLGPYLGIKGGGTGGGQCVVVPEDEINVHFTGDSYAVEVAHNFLSAMVDNELFRGNRFDLDVSTVNWPYAVEVSNGALREVVVGINWDRKSRFFPRKSQFCITSASEIMSILSLFRDREDFIKRIENIVIGFDRKGRAICVKDIGIGASLFKLLKDAIMPNLVQTKLGTPVLIHSGPFANISIGCSSIVADYIGLRLCDYVFTEAGFGMDCGGEKFFDIKCRFSGVFPDCVVLVCSLKAIEVAGVENLKRHIQIVRRFNVPVVVVINRKAEDSVQEIEKLVKEIERIGADGIWVSNLYSEGVRCNSEIIKIIETVCKEQEGGGRFLYDLDMSVKDKMEVLARLVYGADGVVYETVAQEKIDLFERSGFGNLPICVAKTQFSFGHSKELGVNPVGYKFKISDAFLSAGAGFIVLVSGAITTLPALPSHPRALDFEYD